MALAAVFMGARLAAATKPEFPATEVFDKVLAAQESLAWTQADIVKEERAAGDKKTVVSKGHLSSKPGGFARLELTAPSAGLIVSDGRSLWVELPEVQQVMRYSAAKLKQSGNFFLDLAPTIRHYSLSSYRRLIVPGPGFDPDKVSALELQPLKPAQAGFEKLRVWVDQEHWSIVQVRLDYGGTQSTVKFSHRQSVSKEAVAKDPSLDLDPKLFDYKAPKGFEVFDLDM
jgi:outer membrane lipoprotein-sorting protein